MFTKERAGRREVVRADAVVQVRDGQLDRTTLRFGGQLLVEANRDRKSPLFRRYFPFAPSEYVRQPLRVQCEHTLDVVAKELEKLDKKSPLRPYGATLETQAKAALSALSARTQAKAARGTNASYVEEWKEDVNRLRLSTYAALLQIAADNSYGKAWADTFFMTASRAEKEEPASPTPAPPTP